MGSSMSFSLKCNIIARRWLKRPSEETDPLKSIEYSRYNGLEQIRTNPYLGQRYISRTCRGIDPTAFL